ncbi:hypothetical protein [Candidatus Magnetobacterium casense]|uniref:Restriction endonuclease n=1 Tax=Candidatus Magnetobacterium casense TaxID=1455061 RepID=A0ABS6RZM5_9BACT|nr:hypothetical protein [Candidatus Magnetobacterium casensis]MBV6341538.1 hypothetical protein [Candidatus Magnetobacterium casensis]
MDDIQLFFKYLKESMEEHSEILERGEAFGPHNLKGGRFVKEVFPSIAMTLLNKYPFKISELKNGIDAEYTNYMPKGYDVGHRQRVDYVFYENEEKRTEKNPMYFFEIESLDRAQLYLFRDLTEGISANKLWYYYGIIVNNYVFKKDIPKYFIWLLILPDKRVSSYQIWDSAKWRKNDQTFYFFYKSLNELVYENPYKFYDHLIKTSARLFINEKHYIQKNEDRALIEFQDTCELVFITCTGDRLILSRGKKNFENDQIVNIAWRE